VTPQTTRAIASLLIPPLAAAVLLYQVLANLQVGVTRAETLVVIGVVMGVAAAAGTLAAFAGGWTRIAIFALSALLLLDVALQLPELFGRLHPERRAVRARNAQRIADIERLQAALERYARNVGPLPSPLQYGEGIGPPAYWREWWDLSTHDGNGNGIYFLDFLVEGGVVPSVPVDPLNETSIADDPRAGFQYVYFVAPADYDYQGGVCRAAEGQSVYLLAATRLEPDAGTTSRRFSGAECDCLWRDSPNFFRDVFDYVLCGTFDP
jgi:hypothetical protein